MFDIGVLEFIAIAVVALLVFGPDRLPKATAQATHWLRQIREQAQAARQQLTDSIDIDQSMLKDITDLHPRNIARSVMEPVNEVREPVEGAMRDVAAPPPATGAPPQARPAPFDPDAT